LNIKNSVHSDLDNGGVPQRCLVCGAVSVARGWPILAKSHYSDVLSLKKRRKHDGVVWAGLVPDIDIGLLEMFLKGLSPRRVGWLVGAEEQILSPGFRTHTRGTSITIASADKSQA
jgi:hypothetical protein